MNAAGALSIPPSSIVLTVFQPALSHPFRHLNECLRMLIGELRDKEAFNPRAFGDHMPEETRSCLRLF